MEILSTGHTYVFVSFLLILGLYYAYRVLQRPTSKIPGPWYSLWTDIILSFHWLKGTRCHYVHSLHQQYGPVVRIGPNDVDFSDIESVKMIYGFKETFRKTAWYRSLTTARQESVFNTTDLEFHRRHRRLLAGPMAESSLKTLIPLVNDRVELTIRKMKQEMESRGAADVCKWSLFMATDIIGELTFGDSFRMLELGQKNDYARDLEDLGRLGAIRSTFPSLVSIASVVPLPLFKKAVAASNNLRRYATESLDRYERLVRSDPTRVQQTLFTKLFTAEEEAKLTFEEIRSDAQSYIVAGSDTTANTLTYLIWSVCRSPQVKSALVSELQTLAEDFEEAQLRELPYLNHVIDETLRLYSAAPSGLPREVPTGGKVFNGYYLDQGTTVCAQAYTLHRDPSIFPNPETYDPSRWEHATKAMKDAFMPFGRGSRACIGLHLAQIELRLAAARFFLAFPEAKVSEMEGMADDDMVPKIHFLLAPRGQRCLIQAA